MEEKEKAYGGIFSITAGRIVSTPRPVFAEIYIQCRREKKRQDIPTEVMQARTAKKIPRKTIRMEGAQN